MKRILATFIATLVLAVGVPAAPAAAADVTQPGLACADIILDGTHSSYVVSTGREAVLFLQILTEKPFCKGATLTVYFTSDATATTVVDSVSYPGGSGFGTCTPPVAGQGCVTYTKNYGTTNTGGSASAAPPRLYVYLTTAFGRHLIDRAPNANAHEFDLCDPDTSTPDYDETGGVIGACNPPGGEYFE